MVLVEAKVSFQGVVALGGHFDTLCQEVDFYEAFFFIIGFQKEKANHSYSEKSSNKATYHKSATMNPICRNKRAITPKCYNSKETNFG